MEAECSSEASVRRSNWHDVLSQMMF